MTPVRTIQQSGITRAMRRSLRVFGLAQSQFEADRAAGFAPAVPFDKLPIHEKEKYLAAAEGELVLPPILPTRDPAIGVDQVPRAHRAKVLAFVAGEAH